MKIRHLNKIMDNILNKFDWRLLDGYAHNYYVNRQGEVCRVTSDGRVRTLKSWAANGGYLYVRLKTLDGKYKGVGVNRLICQAYHENPENKPIVHHINHIRTDNRPENLTWFTYKENAADRKGRSNTSESGGN